MSSLPRYDATSTPPHEIRLVLGDQLNELHSWFAEVEPGVVYVFLETRSETDYTRHHLQKIVAYFLAMRGFAGRLAAGGHDVHYVTLDDEHNTQSISSELLRCARNWKPRQITYMLPDEYRLDQELNTLSARLNDGRESEDSTQVLAVDTEHFLTTRTELAVFFAGKRRFTMEYFYRDIRRRFRIMVDAEGQPLGGAWNFDHDNRSRLPKGARSPQPMVFPHDPHPIVELLAAHGVATMGGLNPEGWEWPLTREEGLQALDDFIRFRLVAFGTYQDAMTTHDPYLFHARISFAMNSKLISPLEVVTAAVEAWERQLERITINQVEGFVRQIVGWREYMRGVYWAKMPAFAELNVLNHTGELPRWYWNGRTDMNCQAHAVGQSLERAYAHHIQRLMITGNFALLLGVDPDEVDAWYLGVYIDAIEWVEVTNTRGMSQFADGGIVGTKPYISSANYINKMSDYCKTCHYDYKLRHGERACPFNSLYWAFVDRHQDRLSSNGRIGQIAKLWERMGAIEQEAVLAQAEFYQAHRHEL